MGRIPRPTQDRGAAATDESEQPVRGSADEYADVWNSIVTDRHPLQPISTEDDFRACAGDLGGCTEDPDKAKCLRALGQGGRGLKRQSNADQGRQERAILTAYGH